MLFCSTGGALYGRDAPIPSLEDVLPLPESPYGIAKYCAEQYVGLYNRLHGTAHSSLRLANVYGPRQDPTGEAGVIPIFCARVLAGERPTIYGDGTQTRDYVYVGRRGRGVSRRGRAAAGPGTWNIGTGTEVSVLGLARMIGEAAGRPPSRSSPRPGPASCSAAPRGRAGPARPGLDRRRCRSPTACAPYTSGSRPGRPTGPRTERTGYRALTPGRAAPGPGGTDTLAGMPRPDGRRPDQLREVRMTRGWLDHAEGSVLVEFGATRVLCAASVTEELPRWRRGSGLGWVTAEYAMLPRSTNTRNDRESVKGRVGGRTQEISRLVGRSLRACIDPKALGDNTIVIDCDVLQADGGTRTAAITGGYVALADAIAWLRGRNRCKGDPLVASVSAISVGIIDGQPRLDLCYEEDAAAQTDMNVVCTGDGNFVEIQGTAEREPFGRELLDELLGLAVTGCAELTSLQARESWPDDGQRLVLASLNPHKVTELARILAGGQVAVELAGLAEFPGAPEVAETGATFAENALLKATAAAEFTGLPAVADDSGFCVDALNGMPGVLSARWSGQHGDDEANLQLLLGQLADVPDERRGAHFTCAAALGAAVRPPARQRGQGARPGDPAAARRERLRLRPGLRP